MKKTPLTNLPARLNNLRETKIKPWLTKNKDCILFVAANSFLIFILMKTAPPAAAERLATILLLFLLTPAVLWLGGKFKLWNKAKNLWQSKIKPKLSLWKSNIKHWLSKNKWRIWLTVVLGIIGFVIMKTVVSPAVTEWSAMQKNDIASLNWEAIMLLVALGGICAIVLFHMIGIRRVLFILSAILVYVLLMERVREAMLLEGYEGISFLLEAPLNFFDWLGSFVKAVLAAPQEFCEGVIDAIQNLFRELQAANGIENDLQVLKTHVLDKFFELFQEILGIEEKVGTHMAGRETWKAFAEHYVK